MTAEFLKDYLPIILFLIIALGLSCAFIVLNYILSPKNPDPEKLSAYECGFEPFQDSRMEFDVRFYLVADRKSDEYCLGVVLVGSGNLFKNQKL